MVPHLRAAQILPWRKPQKTIRQPLTQSQWRLLNEISTSTIVWNQSPLILELFVWWENSEKCSPKYDFVSLNGYRIRETCSATFQKRKEHLRWRISTKAIIQHLMRELWASYGMYRKIHSATKSQNRNAWWQGEEFCPSFAQSRTHLALFHHAYHPLKQFNKTCASRASDGTIRFLNPASKNGNPG